MAASASRSPPKPPSLPAIFEVSELSKTGWFTKAGRINLFQPHLLIDKKLAVVTSL